MKEAIAKVDQWLIDLATTAWRWAADMAAWIYEWMTNTYLLMLDANSSTMPIGEIIIALMIVAFSVALSFRILLGLYRAVGWFVRGIDVLAHKAAGIDYVAPARRQTVRFEGRWSIHGYESPEKSVSRWRAWRKKLMTPEEQQRYVDQVQKEEARKKVKKRQ